MNVKRYLKKCAKRDLQEILETDKSKSILQHLIENNSSKTANTSSEQNAETSNEQNNAFNEQNVEVSYETVDASSEQSEVFGKQRIKEKYILCPDCNGTLCFNSAFGRFMHADCERANCWYQANEFGECVDNNQMRAERIAKYSGEKLENKKFFSL